MQLELLGTERISPKRPLTAEAGLAHIFGYYAGFGYEWTKSRLLDRTGDAESTVVLDPWNGSGTTTFAASELGMQSLGVDLNPVACAVANFKLMAREVVQVVQPPAVAGGAEGVPDDSLHAWLSPDAAARFRDWTETAADRPLPERLLVQIACFRAIRHLTRQFEGSNPTWVKRAKSQSDLAAPSSDDIDESITNEQCELVRALAQSPVLAAKARIAVGRSQQLPIADSSIDLIVTSPPYLTRIDYGIAYSRELALLDPISGGSRTLRSGLMGTTLIRGGDYRPLRLGVAADSMVDGIRSHESKDSAGYYLKQAMQYLQDLTRSFDELSRVARRGAALDIVVQDSFYKDVPIPLAQICVEEASVRGWQLVELEKHPVTRTLVTMNTAARAYGKQNVAESVITLEKM